MLFNESQHKIYCSFEYNPNSFELLPKHVKVAEVTNKDRQMVLVSGSSEGLNNSV